MKLQRLGMAFLGLLLGTTWAMGAPAVNTLSLQDALRLGLQSNVNVLLARERTVQSRAQETQSRSGLLPNLSIDGLQSNQQISLTALGFHPGTFPGFSSTSIGPFNSFDTRLKLVQNIFNQATLLRARAGRATVVLSQLQEMLAREQVAATVELAYLALLRDRRAVEDAQANVDLAQSLLTQARHQRDAGVATGVDVTRADTRLAQNQVKLAQAVNAAYQAELQLQHVVGLPLGTDVLLSDTLRFSAETPPTAEQAVAEGLQQRAELQVARQEVAVYDLDERAAVAEYYPTMDLAADTGLAGTQPGPTDQHVHNVSLRLHVPLYNGGLTIGQIQEARSRKRQSQLQYHDLSVQVEQDVRQALESVQTANTQVEAANRGLDLALLELKMARDRFGAGLGDNIEVITAQTSLSDARDAQVAALATYHAARINLAAALGRANSFRW